ncbi:hypothetical protein INT47_000727 [Mucor saturninus]|uniref:Uncharacterized protein n=1 Tax=Mucor saturninus TaxID=64648 RepID=A0A8H7QWE8_9FUNG|nr:hypothetical protein INT47_000727 [Mucor saturninus]
MQETSNSSSAYSNEPMTSKWHTWAQEEAQHQKQVSHSPKIVHGRPSNMVEPTPSKSQPTLPTASQLKLLDNPTHCFCKKPAHREYTSEYGAILECASYGYEGPPLASYQDKYTCGFHVHETSWLQHQHQLKEGLTIQSDYPELRTCPLYNFTFCAVFHVTNHHDKTPPSVLPDCYCGHRVKFCATRHHMYFACPGQSNAAFKKCVWKLEAKDVAFTKPKHRLHTYISHEAYLQRLQLQEEGPHHPPPQQQQQQQQKSPTLSKSQHFNNLLDSLNATATRATGTITSPSSVQDEMISAEISPQQQQQQRLMHALIVPTAVLAKKQPSVSNSSSTSTVSTVSGTATTIPIHDGSPTMLKALHELEEYKTLNANLKAAIHRVKQEAQSRIGQVETRLATSVEQRERLQQEYETQMMRIRHVLEGELLMRISSQERLSTIELEVVHLLNEKEKAIQELEVYKESMRVKYGKEDEFNKCKVCFHRSIEYALIPCYHFGKFMCM